MLSRVAQHSDDPSRRRHPHHDQQRVTESPFEAHAGRGVQSVDRLGKLNPVEVCCANTPRSTRRTPVPPCRPTYHIVLRAADQHAPILALDASILLDLLLSTTIHYLREGGTLPTIEVNDNDALTLRVLAKQWDTTIKGAVHQLLEEYANSASKPSPSSSSSEPDLDLVAIHVVHNGTRVNASFDPRSGSVEIVDGALAGQVFKSPSGAAIAIVRHYNPKVNPSRNGWIFFTVTSTGELLQSVRRK